jgi:hypothetical protein
MPKSCSAMQYICCTSARCSTAIRRALNPSPLDVSMLPPAFQALAASDLADQVELIKITPDAVSPDEMSKLWTAIQSHYRPSAAYQVSVVLIEATRPGRSPLPVLYRGGLPDPTTQRDPGVRVNPDLLPPLPTLFDAAPLCCKGGARLGETVTVTGVRLTGSGHRARLLHRLLTDPIEIPAAPPNAAGTRLTFALPNDAAAQANFPPGLWQVTIRFTPTGEAADRDTNAVPVVLAPTPVIAADPVLGLPPATATRGGVPPRVTVTLASRPRVRLEQHASLLLDDVEASAAPRAAAADSLEFSFPNSVAPGAHWLRLRVDGTDSVLLDRSGPVPRFDPTQQITVPA